MFTLAARQYQILRTAGRRAIRRLRTSNVVAAQAATPRATRNRLPSVGACGDAASFRHLDLAAAATLTTPEAPMEEVGLAARVGEELAAGVVGAGVLVDADVDEGEGT